MCETKTAFWVQNSDHIRGNGGPGRSFKHAMVNKLSQTWSSVFWKVWKEAKNHWSPLPATAAGITEADEQDGRRAVGY